ncbi:MAG: zinc dependent phospholipase C family protein [Candidatus Sericytochromatia bacterium]|nr:zinc dependent phospholipase C family protein [Candidatus Sericytochromatia bacterium]
MPKEITHVFFADETNQKINTLNKDKLHQVITENITSFHFGSLAVDTFYYSVKIPFIERNYFQWGDTVHGAEGNDTSLLVISMLDELKKEKNTHLFPQKLAFVSGFLTHMAMDINFHPYVYYFSGNYYDEDPSESANAQMRHRIIEGWIDLYMLDKNKTNLDKFMAIKNIIKDKNINLKLLEFLGKSGSEIWNTDLQRMNKFLKKGYFVQFFLNSVFGNNAFKNFIKNLNSIFDNKLRGLLSLFYPNSVNNMPDFIVNFEMFKNPVTGQEFKGNLDDIWNNALELSSDFLGSVNDYIFEDLSKEGLKDIIKGYSLDVGLIGVKVHEVKYFSPWQLTPSD